MNRRQFMKSTAGAAALMAPAMLLRRAYGQVVAQVPLGGNKIPQFVDPLPDLDLLPDTGSQIVLNMQEFPAQLMPTGFAPANGLPYAGTWVWGYLQPGQTGRLTHLGPVVLAQRGAPTEIKFVNNLGIADPAYGPGSSKVRAYVDSVDQTLLWADPANAEGNACAVGVTPNQPPQGNCGLHYTGPVPAVPHLHGGEVPALLDGGPDAWFLSQAAVNPDYVFYKRHGHGFHSKDENTTGNYAIYRYPNCQEASPIWFHDHTLGATRLNVYAGLAGGYLISDPGLALPAGLTPYGIGSETIIPLVIQDRMFDINGQLFFPNIGLNLEHPFWVPEFVGDTILVNGKVWPWKGVDRKRYRFLFLNGSNARTYDLSLIERVSGVRGPRMWVIGNDGGYLDQPVPIDPNATGVNKAVQKSLVMMPGERYDVIIDFDDPVWLGLLAAAGVAFPLNLILANAAKTPFPGGAPAPKATTGTIMQFRVSNNAPADTGYNPDPATGGGQNLRPAMVRLTNKTTGAPAAGVTVHKTRRLTLNEIMGPGGPLEVVVNNTKYDGLRADKTERADFKKIAINGVDTWYSELPVEGETELWEIINLTADAHPMHFHLVQFQIMNRQPFDVKGYNAAYAAAFPGGVYVPAYGPPLNYGPQPPAAIPVGTVFGGNPDIAPFLNNKTGPAVPVLPHEQGWKDTVVSYPGQVTRVLVRWAPTDLPAALPSTDPKAAFPFDPNGGHGYVWHCHIVDHEDNEMMRPVSVRPNPNAPAPRAYVKGPLADY